MSDTNEPVVEVLPSGVGAMVLQCIKCKTIVGDSWSFVSSNQEWKTITLSGAVNVDLMLDARPQTSMRAMDFGSTFKLFRCRSCQELLGRIYKTTPRALDELRDMFTFTLDKVSSYVFGSVEVSEAHAGTETESESDTRRLTAPLLLTHAALTDRVAPLEDEIVRLKSLCLVFAERLAQLESEEHIQHSPSLAARHKSEEHIQYSPSLAASSKSGSALKRRASDENGHNEQDRAHKKKRT